MRLFNWPPRRIGRLWLIGIGVQVLALLVVPPLLGFRLGLPGDRWPEAETPAVMDTVRRDASDTLPSVPFSVTRVPLASGDTLVRVERDSSFLVVRTDGSAPQFVDASADVQQAAGNIGTVFAGILAEIVRDLIVLAVLLLAIPLLLVAITLTWALGRRPRGHRG